MVLTFRQHATTDVDFFMSVLLHRVVQMTYLHTGNLHYNKWLQHSQLESILLVTICMFVPNIYSHHFQENKEMMHQRTATITISVNSESGLNKHLDI